MFFFTPLHLRGSSEGTMGNSTELLKDIERLLECLPPDLPSPLAEDSDYHALIDFTLEDVHVQRHQGDIPEALCFVLNTMFKEGLSPEWLITERGSTINRVVKVLESYLQQYPEHPENYRMDGRV